MPSLRIRRSVAAATSLTVPVVVCLLLVLLVRPRFVGVTAGLLFLAGSALTSYARVRRRTLTLLDEGLLVQRDGYRMFVPWQGVVRVQPRRHQWVLVVEELVVTGARVEPRDSRGRTVALPRRLPTHPGSTRVLLSVYDKHWRTGPIGARLRSLGVEGA